LPIIYLNNICPSSNNQISIDRWFDNQIEEASEFSISIFENSSIMKVTGFGKEGDKFSS